MELNDIQEIDFEKMTFAEIEKTLADNDKKLLSNLAKIQKLSEENTRVCWRTKAKKKTKLNKQKIRSEKQVYKAFNFIVWFIFLPVERVCEVRFWRNATHRKEQ